MTPYQVLREFNLAAPYLHPVRLRPYEQVAKFTVEADRIELIIRTVRFTEYKREVRFTDHGLRQCVLVPGENQPWIYKIDHTLWTGSPPTAAVEVTLRTVSTPEVYRARRNHELDCYRPGTMRNPLDNVQSSDYAPRMQAHWGLPIITQPATGE